MRFSWDYVARAEYDAPEVVVVRACLEGKLKGMPNYEVGYGVEADWRALVYVFFIELPAVWHAERRPVCVSCTI